jgi:uncharacterized protein (TIGR03083 family)
MMLPGERALREEREAIAETIRSLTDEEFDSAPTLCEAWAPRDILAHVMGVDHHLLDYVRAGGWINTGNEIIVRKGRTQSRDQLTQAMEQWVRAPAPWTRLSAGWLLGDNAVHHQDVLRPLGRTRQIPEASSDAILREGALLGARRLLSYRVEPTDGGRSLGRGKVVRGTREALGLWLAGREIPTAELEFPAAAAA